MAVQRTATSGEIIWDVDWISHELGGGPMKLCIVDTGDGMTGEEMLHFINKLSYSASEQSMAGNYGVGTKFAAATKSPAGVVCQSWKDGPGCMVQLEKDPTTCEYGLLQFKLKNGSYFHYIPLDDAVRPAQIRAHGSMVILMGTAASDSTVAAPPGAAAPTKRISKYLNTRYFKFPKRLVVKARER